jgi:hypothetical protein
MMTKEGEDRRCAPYWHMDCLGTVAILALGFNKRQRKRLAGRYGITEGADEADPITIYHDLHEACHCCQPLVKAISKELDGRFGQVLKKVSSSEVSEIRNLEMPLPLPVLWGTLNDSREDVRLEGRRRLHDLLLQAFRLTQTAREPRVDEVVAARSLSLENRSLKTRISELEDELKLACRRLQNAGNVVADFPRPTSGDKSDTSRLVGRLEREIRKLSHALEKERERTAWLEGELAGDRSKSNQSCFMKAAMPEVSDVQASSVPDDCERALRGSSGCRSTIVCKGDMLCPDRDECTRECPLKDLTVAILGGSEGALPAYRCMVGELGGECLYHNGCLRQGADRLKRIIGQADIVVCITSVNSHAAVQFAKSMCKRSGKRLLVTRESGIHSIREMLQQTVH